MGAAKQNLTLLITILGLMIFSMSISNAQTRTATSDGNWSNSGRWQGGNIGGAIDNDDDIVFNNAVDLTI